MTKIKDVTCFWLTPAFSQCSLSSKLWWLSPSFPAPGAPAAGGRADTPQVRDSVQASRLLSTAEKRSDPPPIRFCSNWTKALKSRWRFCLCQSEYLSWTQRGQGSEGQGLPCLILSPHPPQLLLSAPLLAPLCRYRKCLRWCSGRRSPRPNRLPLWRKWLTLNVNLSYSELVPLTFSKSSEWHEDTLITLLGVLSFCSFLQARRRVHIIVLPWWKQKTRNKQT